MNLLVVGPGAIGTLLACHLQNAGHTVTIADHDPARASFLSSNGIRVICQQGNSAANVRCISSNSGFRGLDYIIFSVKAYSTETAAKEWESAADPETRVVSIQNGLGNLEVLRRIFGSKRVLLAATSEASTLISRGVVRHAARGLTKVVSLRRDSHEEASAFADVMTGAGFAARVTNDAESVVWGKLVVNTAINPISAITHLTNGYLLQYEGLKRLVSKIALETYSISHKIGVRPDIEKDPASAALSAAQATSSNKSSMLQDIERGRRTEIDYINGAVFRVARARKIDAPLNEAIVRIVKELEPKNDCLFTEEHASGANVHNAMAIPEFIRRL